MATPMTADQLVTALRAEGVHVKEHRSWRTHNRNHKGAWGPVYGVYIHHTAGVGSGLADYCYNGSADLPGPVCHGFASKAATVYLIGNGRANHAGGIARNAFTAALNEDSAHPRPDAAEPIDGNVHFYGLEIENKGDGKDPYPTEQYDQAVRWAAAHCRFHKWSADSVIGHKEATRRKVDPSFSMGGFRADVAERLKHPASWSPGDKTPAAPPGPSKTTTPAPAAPVEEPMPAPATLFESAAGGPDLPAGEWLEIPAAEDTAILRGPCTYSVTVAVTLSGTSAAKRVQLRFVHVDIETRRRSAALPADAPVRDGDVGMQVTRAGSIPAGQYLKVEALADAAGTQVTHRTVDGLIWR